MKMFNRLTALITLFLYCFTGFADQTQTNTLSIGKPNSQNKSIIFQKSGNKPVIRMNGTTGVLQFSNDGTNFKDIGSGGGGFKNFVTNFDIEADTSGYSAFKDAAATTPVDGTGGSPTTITLSKTTTVGEVLSQTGSLKVAKSAANGQGEGFSYDVTVDRGWFPGPATISFLQDTTHASYSAGDMVVCVYDKDLASLVVISGADVGSCKSVPKQKGLFQATFNMSTSDDYRVIWHVSTTNASAYNLFFDEVNVNPLLKTDGVAISEWSSYSGTSSSWTNTNSNYNSKYKRTGDSGDFQHYITLTGAGTATFTMTLAQFFGNSGFTLDGSKLSGFAAGDGMVAIGKFTAYDTGIQNYSGIVFWNPNDQLIRLSRDTGVVSATSPFTWAAGDIISIHVENLPISQWAGSANIVNGPRIECATNTSTATAADDTTSFSNSCDGSLVQNITSSLKRRIRWTTAMQPGDQYLTQLSSNKITWVTIAGERQLVGNTYNYASYKDQAGTSYGIGRLSGVNSTDMDLYFGQYAVDAGGAYGAAGSAYSAQGGTSVYYRVLKLSGVAATAYAEAVPGVSPGFVSHLGLKGSTDGSNASSGYVGEVITATASGTSCTTSATTMASITLPAGDWDVYATGLLTAVSGGSDYWIIGVNNVTNSIAGLTNAIDLGYGVAPSGVSNVGSTVTLGPIQKKTAGTYYLICRGGSVANGNFYGTIRARRVR